MDDSQKRQLRNYQQKIQEIHTEQQLRKMAERRFRTTFIYPIAELEKAFGELWKHGEEDDSKLTEKDWEYSDKFETWRKRILDNGNNQLRIFLLELESFLGDKNEKRS